MRYSDFEKRIGQMAASATPEARVHFALDTIRLLYQSAKPAAQEELTSHEQRLLTALIADVELRPAKELGTMLGELNNSMCADPVRAIEFHPDITDLMCAIDNWIGYRRSGDPQLIAAIATNMVNSVDYAIGGEGGEYSIDNMLGAPEMVAEFERQRRLLVPGE